MKHIFMVTLILAITQTSCIVAGGYSSEGGWFFWPWGLLLPVLIVLAFLLLRRRGR